MSVDTLELPKDGLVRARQPGLELRAASDGAAMPTLHGYMIRFGEWTPIDSMFEGCFMERIAPGAATKTLKESRDSIKVLFNHGSDPTTGEKPLAKPTFTEDSEGVRYEGELFDTQYCRELVPALEAGQLGASFKFRVVKETVDEEPEPSADNPRGIPERTVEELQLYEGGPVVFPAYEGATAGVRSLTDRFRSYTGEELEALFPKWVARDPERARRILAEAERAEETVEVEKRGVIAYKKTPTSDASWDAAAVVKDLPEDEQDKWLSVFAWYDSSASDTDNDKYPDAKSAYKFPHHEGVDGPANLTACSSGIGVCNGGMGGADIPDADIQGVYDHLAHHLKDAGKEPPELMPRSKDLEEPPVEGTPASADVADTTPASDDARNTALSGAEDSHSAGSRIAPRRTESKPVTPPWRRDATPKAPWASEKE